MNKFVNRFIYLSALWRFGILMMISVVIAFLFYQHVLAQQIVQIDRYQNQSIMLTDRLKNYLNDQDEILNKKKLFLQEQQKLTDFKQMLDRFNQNAPEQNLLLVAKNAEVRPQEIQISAVQEDQFGKYYSVEITIKSDLLKISNFLTDLISLNEFSVWYRLTIVRQAEEFNLSLAVRYYFGLFDEAVG